MSRRPAQTNWVDPGSLHTTLNWLWLRAARRKEPGRMANQAAVPRRYSPGRVSAAAFDRQNIFSVSNFAPRRHDSKTRRHKADFQSLSISRLRLQSSRGSRLRLLRVLVRAFQRSLTCSPAVAMSLVVTSSALAAAARRAAYRNVPTQRELAARQLQILPRGSGRPSRSQNSLLVLLTQNVFREMRVECPVGIASRKICDGDSVYRSLTVVCVRHRVKSALRKRTATPQPFQRQHDSAARSVARNSFLSILRAGRIKLACSAKKMRKENPIKLHKSEGKPGSERSPAGPHEIGTAWFYSLRGTNFTNSAASGENSAVAAVLRG